MRAVLRLRGCLVLFGGACLLAPAAQASSFVTVAPPQGRLTSSFVILGEPIAPQAAVQPPQKQRSALDMPPDYVWEPAPTVISASVVLLGIPAVEEVKVAAIPTPEPAPKPAVRRKPYLVPKVVRAGIQGHAFPDYVAPAAQTPNALAPQPAAGQPGPDKNKREQPDPAPPSREPPPAIPGREVAEPR